MLARVLHDNVIATLERTFCQYHACAGSHKEGEQRHDRVDIDQLRPLRKWLVLMG
jgi:hypothetical protein